MKRRIIILPAALALLVGGIFTWQSFSFSHLQSQLEKQTTDIGTEYASLVDKDVLPLSTAHTMNESQTRLIAKIQEEIAALKDKKLSIPDTVQTITDLQIALNRFSATSADIHDFAADPLFAQLQTDIGEHGDVRTLLEAYNTTAVKWNRGIQSDVGSLFNRIGGSERPILPYLRFDGQQEFVPVIQL